MSVKINRYEEIHRARSFRMIRENVTLDNGVTADVDFIRHPGATAIVPVGENDTVILIRQYRHAAGEYMWEIPAGTMEPGEDFLTCAKRELVEETGFSADTWEDLGEIMPVPSYSDERIRIFLASGLKPARQNLDADEVLEVHQLPLDTVLEMADRGQITDSKTLSALFMVLRRMKLSSTA